MKTVTTIILSLVLLSGYSQDSLNFELTANNSIQINVSNLLGKNISINYCKFFNKKSALELIMGYQFGWKEPDYSKFSFFYDYFIPSKDPFWFYNKFKFRIGMRFYFKDKSYFAPMLMFNYGFYDNIFFECYEDYDGLSRDKNYIISRDKYSIGSLVKIGKTYNYKSFIIDLYAGLGLIFNIKKTSVNQKIFWDGRPIADDYPLESYNNSASPTVHVGIQIGFGLNKLLLLTRGNK